MMSIREGFALTKEHREKVRSAAVRRYANTPVKISINGKLYNNHCHAARETGLSARSVARYAKSTKPEHAAYGYVTVTAV